MKKIIPFLMICLLFWSCSSNQKDKKSPSPKVQVVSIQNQEITLEKDFVGQVYGYSDIPIRTRVEGVLEQMTFKEGSFVKKGDLLYIVDPQPLLEAVNASKSNLARSKVNYEKALSDLNRIEPLAKVNAVSQKDFDAALAAKKSAASVVEAAQANLRLSQIKLGYSSIKSPVDGMIGKSLAGEGEFVGRAPNPVVLNTVSRIDTILVEFFITENDYLAWNNRDKTNDEKTIDIPLKLILSDGSFFPHEGKINFINREVNAVTGAILIQAKFPNPDRLIRPGQFAKVRAAVKSIPNALLVPQRCVSEVQGKYFVMRINDNAIVEQVGIERGKAYKDYFIVDKGLSVNDKVVYEGLQRAKSGVQVEAEIVEFKSQYKAE